MPDATLAHGLDSDGKPRALRVDSLGRSVLDPTAPHGALDTIAAALGPSTGYTSTALASSAVLKASSGKFRSLSVYVDPTAPTATYYVLVMGGSATVPADGAVTILRSVPVPHIAGIADYVTIQEGVAGLSFTTGCTVCLSSTWATKTISGAYCAFNASVL